MIFLQADTTKSLFNTTGFSDNFVWPLMVVIISAIGALIWNFFFRKKFKISIDLTNSYIGTHNGHDYAIIKINLINETTNPVNNLIVSTIPKYNFRDRVSTMTGGGRFRQQNSEQIVFPVVVSLTENEIDAREPLNIGADNNLEGNLIIDINNRQNKINSIEFSYLTKRISRRINFNSLQVRQLE